jgi:hypothetical protein
LWLNTFSRQDGQEFSVNPLLYCVLSACLVLDIPLDSLPCNCVWHYIDQYTLKTTLQAVAKDWQVSCQYSWYLEAGPAACLSAFDRWRSNYKESIGWPRAEFASNFNYSVEYYEQQICISNGFVDYLRQRMKLLTPADNEGRLQLQTALDETEQLIEIYQTAVYLKRFATFHDIRKYLNDLRLLLDVYSLGAFTQGVMPPPVPLWRFKRLD